MALNMGSVPTLASDLGFMSDVGLNVKVVECDGSPRPSPPSGGARWRWLR